MVLSFNNVYSCINLLNFIHFFNSFSPYELINTFVFSELFIKFANAAPAIVPMKAPPIIPIMLIITEKSVLLPNIHPIMPPIMAIHIIITTIIFLDLSSFCSLANFLILYSSNTYCFQVLKSKFTFCLSFINVRMIYN